MSTSKDQIDWQKIIEETWDVPIKDFVFQIDMTQDVLIHRFLHNRSGKRLDHNLSDIVFVALSFRVPGHVMIKYRTGWDSEGIDEKDDIRDYHTDSEDDEGTQLIHRILLRAPGMSYSPWTPKRAEFIIDRVCKIFGVEDVKTSKHPKIQLRW